MKLLYSVCKTMETYRRGKNIVPLNEVLRDKMYWTYQSDRLSDIITRRGRRVSGELNFSCSTCGGEQLEFILKENGTVEVTEPETAFARAQTAKAANSVFLPAKEVLTSHAVIVTSRDDDGQFGFDDTYYDLAKILMRPPTKGKSFAKIAGARKMINGIFDAKAVYDSVNKNWTIHQGREIYEVSEASEGVKKLSILDILLGNRYIGPGSIVFIDEPESALHPAAISRFMEAIFRMTQEGIQFFMATHSYFVVKKLENIARKHGESIPVFSYQPDDDGVTRWVSGDMQEGLENNPIILESVNLYREDLESFFS
ncbi:MAG: AAA family ATPase, partial [Akkermansia sp.]